MASSCLALVLSALTGVPAHNFATSSNLAINQKENRTIYSGFPYQPTPAHKQAYSLAPSPSGVFSQDTPKSEVSPVNYILILTILSYSLLMVQVLFLIAVLSGNVCHGFINIACL